MLTRLYIDNFRCFEKFEWRPGRKQLILGRNGTGKTSLMDALGSISATAVMGERVDKWFKLSQRTRWLHQREQVFEVEASVRGRDYFYRLVIEPKGKPLRPTVQSEIVRDGDEVLLDFRNGKLVLNKADDSVGVDYEFDASRSALSTISADSGKRGLVEFRKWLAKLSCWHINPFSIEARADGEEVDAAVDLSNIAAWYRHLVQAHPKENAAFLEDLRESLAGFDQLQLDHAGENVRVLYAEFLLEGKGFRLRFDALSDGQRCLICLYAIVHFVVAKGGTVIIDEPDNFMSLREIQPWLMTLEDMADDHKGQVILISHHPEILNQWAGAYGVQFRRDGAGPVRVEKFKGDPGSSLTTAELVARGWDLE